MRNKKLKKRPRNAPKRSPRILGARKNKRAPRQKNYADTMAQTSGMIGQPIAVIQAAKEAGCKAFRHSRVYIDELKKFLIEHADLVERALRVAQAEERQKIADAEIAEHKLAVARGRFIPIEKTKRDVTRHALELKFKIFSLAKTLAPRFALDTDTISIEDKLTGEFRRIFLEQSRDEWCNFECPHCKKKIEIIEP